MFKVGDKVYMYNKKSVNIDGSWKEVCSFITEVVITKVNKTSYSVEHFHMNREIVKNIKFDDIYDTDRTYGWVIAKEEKVEELKSQYLEYKVISRLKSEEYARNIDYYTRVTKEKEDKITILQQEMKKLNEVLYRQTSLKLAYLEMESKALENLKKLTR